VLAVPSQEPGALERYGVTAAEADASVVVIDHQGRRTYGARAVATILDAIGLRKSAALLRLPGAETGYRLVARNRGRLSRVWGDRPPE
jgi:predicted DCC family thiol-disulfide oxidoreductase YuxK